MAEGLSSTCSDLGFSPSAGKKKKPIPSGVLYLDDLFFCQSKIPGSHGDE